MRSIAVTLGALGLALAGVAVTSFAPAQQDEFLPAEKAYFYEVGVQGDRVLVSWIAMPGYYLYRKRLGLESATPQVKLGQADFPQGETHHDEYFGDQEIYRGTATIAVPFEVTGPPPAKFTLKLKWQGCADAGLCYPPTTWTTTVSLPDKERRGMQ